MKKTIVLLIIFLLFFVSCGGKKVVKKVEDPGVLYVEGVNQMKNKKYSDAISSFARVRENYPFDPIAVVAQVKQGDAYFEKKDYVMAASTYEDFINSYPDDENAAYALKRLGESYEKELPTIDRDQAVTFKALERFVYLKNRYPNSPYAADAVTHINTLSERLAAREFYVGEFYYKSGRYNASIMRLEFMLDRFPQAKSKERALHYLIEDYSILNRPDKAQHYMDMLKSEFPRSPFLKTGIRTASVSAKEEKQPRRSSRAQAVTQEKEAPAKTETPRVNSDFTEKKKKEILLTPIQGPAAKEEGNLPERNIKSAETAVNKDNSLQPEITKAESPVMMADNTDKSSKAAFDKEDRLGFFSGKGPIEIDGDSGESLQKGRVLAFKGNVVAKQMSPDPTQTFYLFCDTLTAFTTEDTKEIEKLEAQGNVRLVKQDKTATSKQALYTKDKDKSQVILKGDVVIFLGSDKLSADTVTYFVEEDRFLVQGDKEKRAKATISPKK
jgi:outer membrane protein assembly factor BamD